MSDQEIEAGQNTDAVAAALVSPEHAVLMQRATMLQRLLTYVLDVIFFYALTFANMFVIGFVLGFTGTYQYFSHVPPLLVGLLFFFAYYALQEATIGRTLGKMVTGTRVVNATGGPISFGQAISRTLCRFLPFETFSMLAVDEHGGCSGWHDKIPKTVVISTRKARQ